MNLSQCLAAVARAMPDRPALSSPNSSTLSYAAFEDRVARIAGALRDRHDLQPPARVAILMDNTANYLPALFGIWRAGLSAVPVNAKLHPKEVAWILDDSDARLVLATPDLAAALQADAAAAVASRTLITTGTADWSALTAAAPLTQGPTDPGAEAWLFYTSGTTGRPKGARLSHRHLLFACHAYYADIDWVDASDTYVSAAPLSHGAGLYALPHVLRGAHQIVLPGFDAAEVLAVVARHRNVSMFAAPTMVSRLINHPAAATADTRGLKTLIYGGAPLYLADLKRAIALFGPKLYQLYGQGEAPMTITGLDKRMHADSGHPDFDTRLGSTGVARTGCAFRVVDESGREVPTGAVGEIVTRSDCVMAGYWNNPEATAKALRDGWLWTGDLGAVDGQGFLTLKDRSKDMIISGGSNIYPREIEEVLLTHPDVLECAVVSAPHADWGEAVVAFVVARPGAPTPTPAALDQLCLANIARFKRPKAYRIVPDLPKNNYGKILKTELRAQLLAVADPD